MSDFISEFWNWYVIIGTVVSIGYCAWLLRTTSKVRVAPRPAAKDTSATGSGKGVETTGHVWDGDLVEYNNPLPRWWMWLFWVTIIFSLVYLALYPGLGKIPGMLGWTSASAYAKEAAELEAEVKPLYDKYLGMDLRQVAVDPVARQTGERLFLNNCAQCHGSNAAGGRGFPNLTDSDWLYGGEPATIIASITSGRMGVMPALGSRLGDEGVKNVVAYVRSLSGLPQESLNAQLGKPLFLANCAACHGAEGKGNQAVGAPNLTDNIWLYGNSAAVITEGIMKGRHLDIIDGHTPMPAHKDTLAPGKIQLIAAYVWGLSNNRPAAGK